MDGDVTSSDVSLGTTASQTCSSGLLQARHIPGAFNVSKQPCDRIDEDPRGLATLRATVA